MHLIVLHSISTFIPCMLHIILHFQLTHVFFPICFISTLGLLHTCHLTFSIHANSFIIFLLYNSLIFHSLRPLILLIYFRILPFSVLLTYVLLCRHFSYIRRAHHKLSTALLFFPFTHGFHSIIPITILHCFTFTFLMYTYVFPL